MPKTTQRDQEPRMAIRDADLRQAIHSYGAPPGTQLYGLLRELQERRDREQEQQQERRTL